MPAKVKVRILAGRNLPVMDKSSDASDAFVEVKLGNTTYKTEVYRRSLNPFWNSEWFRFEVSDQELQDEPLQIRIMDYDTYSANDAIGKVYINLNPLLVNPGRSMNGWLPIYDTLHGIRGEINCMVKVNLFADNNRYRHSSCGVRFFFSDIPNGYKCDAILGFVDELLVNDDPEYQWIDKIRTPRASNEARQTLFTKLSGEVQRKLGLKAEIFGGNAVIGYQQSFDLEGGSGIVGRGIGTAVILSKIGYQYDGIISHSPYNQVPYPYSANQVDPSRSSHSQRDYRYPDRHLVHSVSADYFYEVPTGVPNRRLSKKLAKTSSSSKYKMKQSQSFEQMDNNEIEDDDDVDDTSNSDFKQALDFFALSYEDDLDTDQTEADSDETLSARGQVSGGLMQSYKPTNPLHKLLRLSSFNKSLDLHPDQPPAPNSQSRSLNRSSKRRLSDFLILKKLRPQKSNDSATSTSEADETFTYKIVANLAQTTGLIKLLPTSLRTKHTQRASQKSHGQSSSSRRKSVEDGGDLQQQQQESPARSSEATTTNKSFTSPSGEPSPGSQKRRQRATDKVAPVTLNVVPMEEDALSTIEEKLDDDDHQNLHLSPSDHTEGQNQGRVRLVSASSSSGGRGYRKMVRAKEIDLSGEGESTLGGSNSRPKRVSVSSVDNDTGNSFSDENSSSSSTIGADGGMGAKTTTSATPVASESMLSSSSQSASILTDETIKAAKKSAAKTRVASQKSSPTLEVKPTAHLRRSDTDITAPRPGASIPIPIKSRSENRSSSTKSPPKEAHSVTRHSSFKQQYQQVASTSNFVQSVRVIKAQQHLLQNMVRHQNQGLLKSSMNKAKNSFIYPNRIHQSEYPFVTLKQYPEHMIQSTGGVVSVHSVKLLDHIINDEESETRDIWWTEIRKEIRSHAKALNCNTILGYTETSKVLGDVCVLSACGTAATMKPLDSQQQLSLSASNFGHSQESDRLSPNLISQPNGLSTSASSQALKVPVLSASPPPSHTSMPLSYLSGAEPADLAETTSVEEEDLVGTNIKRLTTLASQPSAEKLDCSFCHTPLICAESVSSLANCSICQSAKVPDVLLLTIEPPQNLNIVSVGTLVQARVCRAKRDSHGEASAKEIGDALPFLEYELHRQLFSKLKFKGMNCLFNLEVDISIGENMITGIATGTGCFVLGLPTPEAPQISAGKGIKTSKLNEIQRLIKLSAAKNRENLGIEKIGTQLAEYHAQVRSRSSSMSQQNQELDVMEPAQVAPEALEGDEQTTSGARMALESRRSFSKLRQSQATQDSQQTTSSSSQQPHKRNHKSQHGHGHSHGKNKRSNTKLSHYQGDYPTPVENLINLLSDDNNIVLEVDDNEDADIIALLIDNDIPDGYIICNSESVPTISQNSINSVNMFTQVMRVKLNSTDQFAQQFDRILQALFVKLRRSLPCCLTNVNFVVDLPESHIVQISVTGCLLGLRSSRTISSGDKLRELSTDLKDESRETLQPATSSTSRSPKSVSSSSSESLSPTSSTADEAGDDSSGSTSSSSSSSESSTDKSTGSNSKESSKDSAKEIPMPAARNGKSEPAKSLVKQLSKTNIASLLTGKTMDKKQTKTTEEAIELMDASQPTTSTGAPPSQVNRLILSGRRSAHSMRAVFKKQQTYPGAISPPISGQDRFVLPVVGGAGISTQQAQQQTQQGSSTSNPVNSNGGNASAASRRATIIFNKVKQPLRDLGNNFNTTTGNATTQVPATTQLNPSQSSANLGVTTPKSRSPSRSGGRSTQNYQSTKLMSTADSTASPSAKLQQPSTSHTKTQHLSQRSQYNNSNPTSALNSSIDITSLSYIPGAKEYYYLGNLSFSFVRETNSVRENGGLNGFIHCFLMEVYAIVRAHVSALGGNAFLSFRLQQSCIFYHSNKNQAQCLISVAGDAAHVTF